MTAHRTTDALIQELAGTRVPPPMSVVPVIWGMGLASFVPVALFWVIFGLRSDLGSALVQFPVMAKSLLPLCLAILATGLAFTSGRPGRQVSFWPLALPAVAGLTLVGLRLAEGPDGIFSEVVGRSALACVTSILGMSALPVWIAIRLFRQSAPTRPAVTGGLLGLAVGAAVAAGYALHCTEDSPLFFMTWYVLAILGVAGGGALSGRRLLRW